MVKKGPIILFCLRQRIKINPNFKTTAFVLIDIQNQIIKTPFKTFKSSISCLIQNVIEQLLILLFYWDFLQQVRRKNFQCQDRHKSESY